MLYCTVDSRQVPIAFIRDTSPLEHHAPPHLTLSPVPATVATLDTHCNWKGL